MANYTSTADYDHMFGAQFGNWVVLGFLAIQDTSPPPSKWYWVCECKCGKISLKSSNRLKTGGNGHCVSCVSIDQDKMFNAKFSDWTVLGYAAIQDRYEDLWLCSCSCGSLHPVNGQSLRKGISTKCRACASYYLRLRISLGWHDEMFDARFGSLTVLGYNALDHSDPLSKAKWICKCDCGNYTSVSATYLRSGNTSTCGECIYYLSRDYMFDARFGGLTIVGHLAVQYERNPVNWKWLCLCDCGNFAVKTEAQLQNEHYCVSCAISDGQSARSLAAHDKMYGKKYGSLTALGHLAEQDHKYVSLWRWLFRCDCGRYHITRAGTVRSGTAKTCGMCRHSNGAATDRGEPWVNEWKIAVFKRDGHKCQACGKPGPDLNAHHIYGWMAYPLKRIYLNNGVTLCGKCHKNYHAWNGGNRAIATKESFEQWLEEV